jgi:hypothetical protein
MPFPPCFTLDSACATPVPRPSLSRCQPTDREDPDGRASSRLLVLLPHKRDGDSIALVLLSWAHTGLEVSGCCTVRDGKVSLLACRLPQAAPCFYPSYASPGQPKVTVYLGTLPSFLHYFLQGS